MIYELLCGGKEVLKRVCAYKRDREHHNDRNKLNRDS